MDLDRPIFLPGDLVVFHPAIKNAFKEEGIGIIIGLSFEDGKGSPIYDVLHKGEIKTVYWDWLHKYEEDK